MIYFAKLGLNSKVVETIHIGDEYAPTEKTGIEYLQKNTNYPFWVQTFKDKSQRKNFAGAGMIYDEDRDAFIPPKPFNSWTLNEETCQWEAPVALPDKENRYNWDEETQQWDLNE
tara:strand:- start:517 stop:861 length:345 start_codon:yes stop_codon:yes gene_type:complete